MTNAEGTEDPVPPGGPGTPADIPAGRPAALARLEALPGEWEMEASFAAGYFGPDSPPVTSRGGRTTFAWLDGRFFLIQRFSVDNPSAPSGIAIIGADASAQAFVQHYYDSRGVHRVYHMGLDDGVWRLWREAPGFSQRYTGVFSDDGKTINGAWEMSADGAQWMHDFGLSYIKVMP